ncbi:hypothetical protein BT96DRAFT_460356 [Gymnopus androsaceus JB14]|uniref:F-box domain-containing protein n=1 Tax=Gymnopus androsaceus JB14 TaxID=1447944 RepID=A0A6A4IH40_9AGAR|nr:hypothetical protein BT96DRAFT_460356 [Gymnopus androsaceus JB14]
MLIWVPLHLEYPRPSITHLHLGAMTPTEASRVILYCPNVQALKVNNLLDQDHDPLPTISSNTSKFTIDFEGSNFIAQQQHFSCLTFPELSHLEIMDTQRYHAAYHLSSLGSMLGRSPSARLTHLTIRTIYLTFDELCRLFLCVPSVTALELEESTRLHYGTGVYLVLKSLIAPPHRSQRAEEYQAEDCDEVMDLKNHGECVDETDDDNDGENEDDLDGGDKETDIEVLEGQCLLPRLKDLHLVIRPRNRLLLELVRSRWKPSLRN